MGENIRPKAEKTACNSQYFEKPSITSALFYPELIIMNLTDESRLRPNPMAHAVLSEYEFLC